MSAVLLLLAGLMLTLLGASQTSGSWAEMICDNAYGMCGRPSLLAVWTIIALGIYVVQR